MSSRIPLQVAAPSKRRRSRLPWIGVGIATSIAIGVTTLTWTGEAHAERSAGEARTVNGTTEATTTSRGMASIYDIQNDLNRIRAEKRLGPLNFDSILTQTSGAWATTIASENRLRHDPNLVAGYEDGWTTLSESVSAGSTMDAAYASILGNQRQAAQVFSEKTNAAGVGFAEHDGQVYLVLRFAAQASE